MFFTQFGTEEDRIDTYDVQLAMKLLFELLVLNELNIQSLRKRIHQSVPTEKERNFLLFHSRTQFRVISD